MTTAEHAHATVRGRRLAQGRTPLTLGSDAKQFRTTYLYQLRSYVRTWRFVGLLVFVALIATAVLAVQLSRGTDYVTATNPTSSDYLAGFLGYLTTVVVITGAFLGGDALAVDLGGGPGYLMLTQPVRRGTLLLGRYAAAVSVSMAVVSVYYAFSLGAALYFYGTVPSALFLAYGLTFLFVLSVLAFAFFFSSFFRTSAVSIVTSLLILFLGFPIITAMGDLTGVEPWFSLDYGSSVITGALSTHFQHETVSHMGGGARGVSITLYTFSPYLWEGVVILVGYLLAFLAASFLVYRYKEVRG